MWTKIARLILKNRVFFLIAIGILTVFMGYQAQFVQMSYKYAALLPDDAPASKDYQKFKSQFGQEGNVMFIAIQDKNFYEIEKFKDWVKMGDSIKTINGIDAVVSIGHTINLKKDKVNKRFTTEPIFPKDIKNQAELDSISKIAESLPFYRGTLVNKETQTYAMGITVNENVITSKLREKVMDQVCSIINDFGEKYNIKVRYSGLPYIRVVTARMIKKEMNMFIILSLFITAVILFLFFRSFKTVAFCLLVVSVSVIWAIGFMSLFDYKITLLTAMLPPLLIVIGIPNSVFLINKFHGEYARHGNKIKALQRVIHKIGNATFLTNLTTASGFATFIVTNSDILKEFGVITSINIMVVFVMSLVLIPIIFSYLTPPKTKHIKHLENKYVNSFIKGLVHIVTYKRNSIYTISIIVFIIAVVGIFNIKSTGYMVDDLPHHNQVYKDLKFFEKNFDGLMPLEIMVDTKKPKGLFRTSSLNKIDKLQNKLSSFDEISRPISYVEAAKFSTQAFYNGLERFYRLPKGTEKNFILKYISSDSKETSNIMKTFVDSTKRIARLSFRIKDIGTTKMSDVETKILKTVNDIFPSEKYDVITTGGSIIFFKGTQYLIRNLFVSLLLAIFLIASFMAWMFSSKRMVLIALIPNLFPLVLTASLMGFFGIPIKASTILIFSIAFGISVDDTIHYLAKYRQELEITNWNIKESVILALKETGQSMIYTSIILFFGFGIFSLSEFGGTVSLGVLVSFTLLTAMFSNLVILPSLLLTLEKLITNKSFKEPLLHIFDEEEDIDYEALKIKTLVPLDHYKSDINYEKEK